MSCKRTPIGERFKAENRKSLLRCWRNGIVLFVAAFCPTGVHFEDGGLILVDDLLDGGARPADQHESERREHAGLPQSDVGGPNSSSKTMNVRKSRSPVDSIPH